MFKKYNDFLIDFSGKLEKSKYIILLLAVILQFVSIEDKTINSVFVQVGIVMILLALIALKKEFENIAGKYAVAIIVITYVVIYLAATLYSLFGV